MFKKILLVAVISTLTAACKDHTKEITALQGENKKINAELKAVTSDLAALNASLNGYKYIGVDPQLSIQLNNIEFYPSTGKYASPEVSLSLNIKQHNDQLPLKEYQVYVTIEALGENGKSAGEFYVDTPVINGLAAVTAKEKVYSDTAKALVTPSFRVKSYYWEPELTYKPFNTLPQ